MTVRQYFKDGSISLRCIKHFGGYYLSFDDFGFCVLDEGSDDCRKISDLKEVGHYLLD